MSPGLLLYLKELDNIHENPYMENIKISNKLIVMGCFCDFEGVWILLQI